MRVELWDAVSARRGTRGSEGSAYPSDLGIRTGAVRQIEERASNRGGRNQLLTWNT
jgi:hypothetical protein